MAIYEISMEGFSQYTKTPDYRTASSPFRGETNFLFLERDFPFNA